MDLKEIPTGAFLRHPWEVARAAFFRGELRRAGLLSGARGVLDVGSGDAWLARELTHAAEGLNVVCWDLGYEQASPAPSERVTYTATRPSGTFDLVLMLDVAEHVPDDRAFLRDVLACTAPGAHVLFSVPAWPSLFSAHDEALGHYRRYTPRAARELLRDSGLDVVRGGGLFHSLLLPRYVQKLTRRANGTAAVADDLAWRGGRLLRSCVLGALAVDAGLSRVAASIKADVPGLSWWALCRRS